MAFHDKWHQNKNSETYLEVQRIATTLSALHSNITWREQEKKNPYPVAKVCDLMKSQPLSSDPAASSLPTSQNSNPADVLRRHDDSNFDVFSKIKQT